MGGCQPVDEPVSLVQGACIGTLVRAVYNDLVQWARLGTLGRAVYNVLTGAFYPQYYLSRTWVLGWCWLACELALPQGALSRGPRNYLSGT